MFVEWDSKSRINVFLRPWFLQPHTRDILSSIFLRFSSSFFFVYKCSSFSFFRYVPFVLLKLYFLFGLRNESDPSPFCFEFSLLKYNIALEKFLLSSFPFFLPFFSSHPSITPIFFLFSFLSLFLSSFFFLLILLFSCTILSTLSSCLYLRKHLYLKYLVHKRHGTYTETITLKLHWMLKQNI